MATIKTLRKTGGDFTNTTQFKDWFVAQFPLSANVELHVQGGQHFGHIDSPDMDGNTGSLVFSTSSTNKFNGYQLLVTTDPSELSSPALLDVKWEFNDVGNAAETELNGLLKFDKIRLRGKGFNWDDTRLITMFRSTYRTSLQFTNCIIYLKTNSIESFDNIAVVARNYQGIEEDNDNSFIENCHIILTRNNEEPHLLFVPLDNYSNNYANWGVMHNSVVTCYVDGTWHIELRHGANYNNTFFNYGSGDYDVTTTYEGTESETVTGVDPKFVTNANQAANELLSTIIARDVQLLEDSPLLNTAIGEYSPPDDILGVSRSEEYDRGAYVGFIIPPEPPEPSDINYNNVGITSRNIGGGSKNPEVEGIVEIIAK